MKKFIEGMKVSFSMLYGGTVRATVTKVTDTTVTLTETWVAEDTLEQVSNDTVYNKQVDEDGNEYIVTWEYYDHKGTVYGEDADNAEMKARKMIARRTTAQLFDDWDETEKSKDPNVSIVRGWLMDEFQKRDLAGFDAWLDCEDFEKTPRDFIM